MKRTTKKRRRGRPELPKHQRKSVMLCARVEAGSYRRCVQAARAVGVPLTDWIRDRLYVAAKRDLAR